MIKQLITSVLLIIWYIYVSYGYVAPFIFINKHETIIIFIEKIFQILVVYALKYGFQTDIYYTSKIDIYEPNKINIVICNHVASIDMFIMLSYLKHCNIDQWIGLGKRELIYIPGLGVSFRFGKHIKVLRNFEEDKINIIKQLEQINEGTIIIFPEGTRFDPIKFKEGQQYSKDNNLPLYDNLLVPKTKGLWLIYNYLKEHNKLGNIYDTSIIIQNFLGKKAHMKELVINPMGNVFIINRKLVLPNLNDINDFKKWLFVEWKKKDELINMYNQIVYQKIYINNDNNKIILYNLLFFGLVTYGLVTQPYLRYYFMITIVLIYLLSKKN